MWKPSQSYGQDVETISELWSGCGNLDFRAMVCGGETITKLVETLFYDRSELLNALNDRTLDPSLFIQKVGEIARFCCHPLGTA